MAATAAVTASSPVHSTPKPPKKRYLENSEFRGKVHGPIIGAQ